MAEVDELYAQGEKLKDEGKYEESVAKFLAVLQLDQRMALAHFALAVVYGKLGQHEQAVQHGARGCELEPDDPFSYTALSVTYQRAFAGTRDQRYIQLAEEAMGRAHMLQSRR
jgi:tetratricopeptide (TPR) repeat protein